MLDIEKKEVEKVVKEMTDVGVFTCDKCGRKTLAQEDELPYFEIPPQWVSLKYEDSYYHLCPVCAAFPVHLTAEVFNARESR